MASLKNNNNITELSFNSNFWVHAELLSNGEKIVSRFSRSFFDFKLNSTNALLVIFLVLAKFLSPVEFVVSTNNKCTQSRVTDAKLNAPFESNPGRYLQFELFDRTEQNLFKSPVHSNLLS